MIRIENRFQLKQVRAECQAETKQEKCRVLICGGTGCLAGGSAKLYEHMKELAAEHENVQVEIGPEIAHIGVHKSGCHGFCEMGPLMRIEPYGYLYLKVQESDCGEIFEKTVLRGQPVERLMFRQDNKVYPSEEEIPFYAKQTRLVLKNCGHIDAERIEAAIAAGAYEGLEKALFEMTPKAVIQAITDSKLRGRGGAGFPAGKKWSQVTAQKETVRYVVCNGDEGDPGAFMDRSIMEGDPHRMIEGMLIAAYAVGAQEGYIYVRAEYPLAIERLKLAIAQAEEAGFLGDNILGTDFCFRGQAGYAPRQAAPHCGARPVGEAHGPQQRGDLRQRAHDHSARRGVVPGDRYAGKPRHQGVRPYRQRVQHRSDRGPHGHASA